VTHLDLFTGIGGFHIAAGWAGFQTIGFSEIEPYCCALIDQKWPGIPNYGDIRTAGFSRLRGFVTVLSAGVPCQPASLAGKRRGKDDDRWLWPATLDVVGCVQPAWCIFENPDGIASLHEFRGILLRLEGLGYSFRLFRVPANAVGAKHRRYRVFIVANSTRELPHWSGFARSGGGSQSANGCETLANAACGIRQWQASGQGGHAAQCVETLADTDRAGLEEHESREQRQRTAAIGSCGPDGFRLTQPPLCGRADGVRDRSHRLKALGNAVVPQQAYPFFAAIAQVEQRMTA
jgi:DNA (cytosine-5)-methyltransferase 1